MPAPITMTSNSMGSFRRPRPRPSGRPTRGGAEPAERTFLRASACPIGSRSRWTDVAPRQGVEAIAEQQAGADQAGEQRPEQADRAVVGPGDDPIGERDRDDPER